MDDFREWLSDNLRYFMLGGAILIVLLALIFGIRLIVKNKKAKSEPPVQIEQEQNEDQKKESKDKTNDNPVDQMEKADEEVTALVENFFKALGDKDVDTLAGLVDSLEEADAASIVNANDLIEKYEVKDVYTKPGMEETANVIYAVYHYYCKDIATPVPALDQFYVKKDESGAYKIDGKADTDPAIKKFTETMLQEPDVKALTATVQEEYEAAKERDQALKTFLTDMEDKEADSAASAAAMAAANGTTLVANDDCNLRETPEGGIMEVLSKGETVTKLGVSGDWIQVEYMGEEGYIFGELLNVSEGE